jgi:[citrate (pro-3S)-lyase] ligase
VEAAAVVVNCNPFTLGHRHLIEKASRAHEKLFVFVLEEELSLFPFAVRMELVKRGTRNLSNVVVLPSGPYVISRATFPSYFLREKDKAEAQAGLDAEIFASRIAPAAFIKKRYVGEEPFCATTRQYNEMLEQVLKEHGLGFEVIERRKDLEGLAISASRVRALLKSGDLGALRDILPETTSDFLESDEARPIIEKIKGSDSLH